MSRYHEVYEALAALKASARPDQFQIVEVIDRHLRNFTGTAVPDELPEFLRWCADELVKRDTQAGTFARSVAESLDGRALILEAVDRRYVRTAAAMQANSHGAGVRE